MSICHHITLYVCSYFYKAYMTFSDPDPMLYPFYLSNKAGLREPGAK